MTRLFFVLALLCSFTSAISFKSQSSLSAASSDSCTSCDDNSFGDRSRVVVIKANNDAENRLNMQIITALAGGAVQQIDISGARRLSLAVVVARVARIHRETPCTDIVWAGTAFDRSTSRVFHEVRTAWGDSHARSLDTCAGIFNTFDTPTFAGVRIHFATSFCDALPPFPQRYIILGLCETGVIVPMIHNDVRGWLTLARPSFERNRYYNEYEHPIITPIVRGRGRLPPRQTSETIHALRTLDGRRRLEFLTIVRHEVRRSIYPGCVYGHEIKTDSEWIPTSISCGQRLEISLADSSKVYLSVTHSVFVKTGGKGELTPVPAGYVKEGDVVMLNDKTAIPVVNVVQSPGRLVNVWTASGHFWLDGVKVEVQVDESKADLVKRMKELDPDFKIEPAGSFVLNELVYEHRQEIMAAWAAASKEDEMVVPHDLSCWSDALKTVVGAASIGSTVSGTENHDAKPESEVQKIEEMLKGTPKKSTSTPEQSSTEQGTKNAVPDRNVTPEQTVKKATPE